MPYSPRSVIVVRDPWERIKSAYKGKLIDRTFTGVCHYKCIYIVQ